MRIVTKQTQTLYLGIDDLLPEHEDKSYDMIQMPMEDLSLSFFTVEAREAIQDSNLVIFEVGVRYRTIKNRMSEIH